MRSIWSRVVLPLVAAAVAGGGADRYALPAPAQAPAPIVAIAQASVQERLVALETQMGQIREDLRYIRARIDAVQAPTK